MRPAALSAPILGALLACAAWAQTRLEWKYPPGSYRTQESFQARQLLRLGGMELKTDVAVEHTLRATIRPAEADGSLRVEMATEATRFHLDAPGLMVQFDSGKPETARTENAQLRPFLEALNSLSKLTYTLVYGKDGRVAAVEGLEKTLETLPPAVVDMFRAEIHPETFRREANQAVDQLPAEPVKPGDRWKRTEVVALGSGQTLTFELWYTYRGTEQHKGRMLDRIDILAESVRYAIAPDSPLPVRATASDLKIESSTGALFFDRELGAVVESRRKFAIRGGVVFSVGGLDVPGDLELDLETASVRKE